MSRTLPVFFLSHGPPTMALGTHPKASVKFLKSLGESVRKLHNQLHIKCLLVISAHWESSEELAISSSSTPEQIYDFYGFPQEMYSVKMEMCGSPELAQLIKQTLDKHGIASRLDSKRGIDHGAWVPLVNMFGVEGPGIPVIQLSLNRNLNPQMHQAIGKALRELRQRDILIIGSGGAVHNLQEARFRMGQLVENDKVDGWAREFDNKVKSIMESGDPQTQLLDLMRDNPKLVKQSHPRTEHFMPLFVMAGALDADEKAKQIHTEIVFGNLSMAAYKSEQ
eukprot:Partr_v1_DN26910_c0_g1_i1_m7156 putative dioxygenase